MNPFNLFINQQIVTPITVSLKKSYRAIAAVIVISQRSMFCHVFVQRPRVEITRSANRTRGDEKKLSPLTPSQQTNKGLLCKTQSPVKFADEQAEQVNRFSWRT